jgi:hypothetical protein
MEAVAILFEELADSSDLDFEDLFVSWVLSGLEDAPTSPFVPAPWRHRNRMIFFFIIFLLVVCRSGTLKYSPGVQV